MSKYLDKHIQILVQNCCFNIPRLPMARVNTITFNGQNNQPRNYTKDVSILSKIHLAWAWQ